MKTQIISLESHDDLISIRDRISWVKTPRVLLVWPKYARLTLRSVDLKVLQRHAAIQGAQLGLVTRKWDVIHDAESLGIPVFDSTSEAQKLPWPERALQPNREALRQEFGEEKKPRPARKSLRQLGKDSRVEDSVWKSLPIVRAIAFSVGVLSVLAVVSLFVPRGSVVVYPQTQLQSVMIPVLADPASTNVVLPSIVPSREKTLTTDGQQSLTVTSQISIPQKKAQGIVQLSNLTQQEIFLPQGTVVYSIGDASVRFATLNDVHIKAGVGETVEVRVEAVEPGVAGNLPPESIKVVEGSLGLSVLVTNTAGFAGGVDHIAVGATVEDRERLRATLMDQLAFNALRSFNSSTPAEKIFLLPDTLNSTKILSESFSPPAGQAGTPLTLSMQIEFAVRYVDLADLQSIARVVMDPAVPLGYRPDQNDVSIKFVGEPVSDERNISAINLEADRILVQDVDPNLVFNLIHGRSPRKALEILIQQLSMRRPPEIAVTPSWWPLLPALPFRMSVTIQ